MGEPHMHTSRQIKSLYQSLRDGDVSEALRACAKATTPDARSKLMPTVHDDTILHMAIYMGKESIAIEIIDISSKELITIPNKLGNTALHEAAAAGYVRVVEKLLEKAPDLLVTRNKKGEMPLYTAVQFGKEKVFSLLAGKLKNDPDLVRHLCRPGSYVDPATKLAKLSYDLEHLHSTILHAAIHPEFFGLALLIARKPEYAIILQLKDRYSLTPLQLLSSKSAAFKSGMKCGWIKWIIYNCAPYEDAKEEDGHEQDSSDDDSKRSSATQFLRQVISSVYKSVWSILLAWRTMRDIYDEKKKHGLAFELAKCLIAADDSWRATPQVKKDANVSTVAGVVLPSDEETRSNRGIEIVDETLKDVNVSTVAGVVIPLDGEATGLSQSETPDITSNETEEKLEIVHETSKDVNESNVGGVVIPSDVEAVGLSLSETPDIPLFIATGNGIFEIVEEILRVHPLSVEYTNKEKQNILHLAVMYRQWYVLHRVTKKYKELTSRLAKQIDKHGFSILHYVGNMKFYKGGTQHGPVLQLQEELEWFEEVKKLVPPHYEVNRTCITEQRETHEEFYERKYKETKNKMSKNVGKIIPPNSLSKLGWDESKEETPIEYFGRIHGELLEEAQQWLERTSNSCSLVAALIASVVFAAAFTIPGGNNRRSGRPLLIDSPFFVVFIITDALSIASSLMSLAMFLSILSSPYDLDDFRHSLPRKLTLGFTSLFFSVAVTSLAFASTLMLTIPMKKRVTTTLIYCVAFLPVTMFALLQYPLFLAFKKSFLSTVKAVKRVLPWQLIQTYCSLKSHTS